VLGPVSERWAGPLLGDLVDLQRTGLAEPIPFAPKTSAEYARVRRKGWPIDAHLKNLEKLWARDRDTSYEQFFGPGVSLETLLSQAARPNEVRGDLGEPSRFGTLARRVFQPLLANEDLR
jgi:exodeoxyribonuclease V gamma subunit